MSTIYKLSNSRAIKLLLTATLVSGVFVAEFSPVPIVRASSIITVNSTADTTANDGQCTLREAITSANTDTASGAAAGECIAGSGTDTIAFNISGTADFVNGGQNGYTIQPTTGLPQITEMVNIDGYTQPGAQANTAIAPNPLNGRLLIELNGDNAGSANGLNFFNNSHGSTVKGLVINGFDQGDAIWMLADNIVIRGNYIGVNPAGNAAKPNSVGVTTDNLDLNAATGVLVGGLNPVDRNLISGNTAGTAGTASYPGTDWVIQGNYIGVAADGLTPIDNSTPGGSGSLSADNCTGTIIGGSQTGAINVIGASLGHGIAPHEADNLTIEGNYIGLGYDGTTVLGNITPGSSGAGIALSNSDTVSIKNNRVAGWIGDGVAINSGNTSVTVEGNVISDNGQAGISVGSSNVLIFNNTITTSTLNGINVFTIDNTISGNTVSSSAQSGIALNSGATTNEVSDNTITTSTQSGISVSSADNTISGNTISDSTQNGIYIDDTDNIISDNTVSTSGQSGIRVTATGNAITSNAISDSTQNGIYIDDTDNIISDNTVSTSGQSGIRVTATGNTITSNAILDNTQNGISVAATNSVISGNTATDNTLAGISINASDNQILDNTISNNHGPANLILDGRAASIQEITVQGNKIGTRLDGTIDGSYTQGGGILILGGVASSLIGGTSSGDGNIIAGNASAGMGNAGMSIAGFGVVGRPSNITIIGNSIFGNDAGNVYGFAMPGLGIDNYMVNLDGSFVPQSTTETGVTANDATDTDAGPNNYINFPVLNSAIQTNDSLAINYDLDAADSPTNQYRIEFFANDAADPSGNGEGQTYLGSVTATNGTGNTATLALPTYSNLTGKTISATTTAIDSSTASGFGSTSEFSANLATQIVSLNTSIPTSGNNQPLADTGYNLWGYIAGGVALLVAGLWIGKFKMDRENNRYQSLL